MSSSRSEPQTNQPFQDVGTEQEFDPFKERKVADLTTYYYKSFQKIATN